MMGEYAPLPEETVIQWMISIIQLYIPKYRIVDACLLYGYPRLNYALSWIAGGYNYIWSVDQHLQYTKIDISIINKHIVHMSSH